MTSSPILPAAHQVARVVLSSLSYHKLITPDDLRQRGMLQRDLKASEDKRTHAETLLDLTRIQLGIERECGSIRRSQPALPPIPEDIRRFIASRCHPDHNQDSEVSTRAMAWLNAIPRGGRP